MTVVDYGEDDFELMAELQRVFHTKTLAEWTELFVDARHPGQPGRRRSPGAADDPHLQARGIIVDEHHPAVGDLHVVGNPIRTRGETFAVERHAPALAEHTDEILAELGYAGAEIDALRDRGIV